MTQICQFFARIPPAIMDCLKPKEGPKRAFKECSIEEAYVKMRRNMEKACLEHRIAHLRFDAPSRPLGPVTYRFKTFKGSRASMEDSHIYHKIKNGVLVGVFDGHSGFEVAAFAASYFEKHFESKLCLLELNVYMAMIHVLFDLQNLINSNPRLCTSGSTALLSFIKADTSEIFTMTLGDSEAFIYRTGQMIPLSCVRDWTSKKDFDRASKGRYGGIFLSQPFDLMHPKEVRYGPRTPSLEYGGLNLSRSLGDAKYDAISHKPKITVFQASQDDVLLLACDGLIDYLPRSEMVRVMESSPDNPAEALFESMLDYENEQIDKKRGDSPDNCTILSLQI